MLVTEDPNIFQQLGLYVHLKMHWHIQKPKKPRNNSLKAHGFVWFSAYNLLLYNSVIVTITVKGNVKLYNYNINSLSTSQNYIHLFFRYHLLTTSYDHFDHLRFYLEHSARNNISDFQFNMLERVVVQQRARCCPPALVAASTLHSCLSVLDWQGAFVRAASGSQTLLWNSFLCQEQTCYT